MKIGIDCRLWSQTGVGRYIRNLVKNLTKLDKENEYVLFVSLEEANKVKSVVGKRMSIVPTDIHWHSVAEQTKFPKVLNQQELDVVHFPYFSLPILYYKPFVVTIHDLIVNKHNTGRASTLPYPLYLAKRAGYHTIMAAAVYRASKIIVPSNTVKEDLIKNYMNVNQDKINVTYEGSFDASELKTKGKKMVEGDYLLRVGNLYPHKNVEGLLVAFKNFIFDNYENKDAKLVLVGKKDYFYSRIAKNVSNLNIEPNVVFLENLEDEDLISLYQNAKAAIVPSFSEGFSLTAVEALASGCPAVVSDIPVHREICGNAAIYFNPSDLNDIAQKIDFAFSITQESRDELVDQGKKQAKKFSWDKMTQETIGIYNSVSR